MVIDPHYKTKHSDITEALILELVQSLDGREFQVQERDGECSIDWSGVLEIIFYFLVSSIVLGGNENG